MVLKTACYVTIAVGFNNLSFRVTKNNFRTVNWVINVVGSRFWFVEIVSQSFLLGTDITHDITFGLFIRIAVPSLDTTIVTDTLLTAPIRVHSAVTSRAIYVEVSLYQVTRIAMLQYAKVTGITIHCRLATHLSNITIDTHVSHAPIGVELHLIVVYNEHIRPSSDSHLITILHIWIVGRTVHRTTEEIRWIVDICVSVVVCSCCVRVNRNEVVRTPVL